MSIQSETQSRADLLKRLREQHSQSVTQTQAYYKEQRSIHTQICSIIRDTPKTVPEVAEAVDLPSQEVLWHLTTMKKYGLVVESGMCGDYPLYQKVDQP
ncbi:MAG: helix-turn-helix transcriptional regulator [Anaerolineales bacterium]|nr:helix-turn-helix transcriptional regulator [Anaerolineales bacterium]